MSKRLKDDGFVEIPLKLEDIRDSLIRQEETIIFALIERAQFARNDRVYHSEENSLLASDECTLEVNSEEEKRLSFMRYFLLMTERLHGQLGRYTVPDEHPFNAHFGLPKPAIPREWPASPIKPNSINENERLLQVYSEQIVPEMCRDKDDLQYGSTCVCDIAALQALSRRVHYGKWVAEAKFQARRERFTELIKVKDTDGLMTELTDLAVEDNVIHRVLSKASRYATDKDGGATPLYKLNPQIVAKVYREILIPLNKDVQVAYLLQRLD